MKKIRMIVTAILAFAVSLTPISAKAEGGIDVTYQVDPSYEVELPSDTNVPFLTEKTSCGTILIEKAVLEENKCILVDINSNGNLINEHNTEAKIPYQIVSNEGSFSNHKYTEAGEETKLYIAIGKEDWEKAVGGRYTAEITFTVSYVDKEYPMSTTASQGADKVPAPTTHTIVIDTTVPDVHTVAIDAEHASALYVESDRGISDAYPVPRFSTPQFKFTAEDGYIITHIFLNGTDVTDSIKDDTLLLSEVRENQVIKIETEEIPQESIETPETTPETPSDTVDRQEEENAEHFNFRWVVLPLLSAGVIAVIIFLVIKRRNNKKDTE